MERKNLMMVRTARKKMNNNAEVLRYKTELQGGGADFEKSGCQGN